MMENLPIIIYGAGNNGKKLLNFFKKKQSEILFFIDKNAKENQFIDEIPIYSLKDAPLHLNAEVYISVFNRDTSIVQIKSDLHKKGFKHVFTFLELAKHSENLLSDLFWLTNPNFYNDKTELLESVRKLFKDSESLSVFESTINARLQLNVELLPTPRPLTEQYFSKDIPLKSCKSFVDAGAYNGDSIPALMERFPQLDTYFGFEPDIKNFIELADCIPSAIKNTIIYPCGLWDKVEILKFQDQNGESSTIGENGNIYVPCITLDHIIFNHKVDYLKMDIEGAEKQALHGAKNIIQNQTPDLAICVYHKPEDIFELPLLIDSWNLGYSFYLRQYGHCGFDLVLYACQ